MSEKGSAQLHSKLFRRRHSTRQSHGLFALAKHLSVVDRTYSYSLIREKIDQEVLTANVAGQQRIRLRVWTTVGISLSQPAQPRAHVLIAQLLRTFQALSDKDKNKDKD